MHRFWIVAALLVLARCCAADVVETRDGRTLRGKVLNRGELARSSHTVRVIRLLPDERGRPVMPIPREEVANVIVERNGISTVYDLEPTDALASASDWSRASPSSMTGWLAITGSASRYAMSDLNESLDELNALFAVAHFDHVNGGAGFGVSTGVRFGPGRDVGVGYERLLGSSEASDATGRLEFQLPANLFRVVGSFGWPLADRRVAGLELGAGIALSGGALRFESGGASERSSFSGSGLLAEGAAFGETPLFGPCDLHLAIGYRRARMIDVRLASSPAMDLDYSGVFLRASLMFETGGE